ncbi:MAG TPA: AlkA N-terminal domain-containing protein [Longimicrobiaceae bacterium]|nr:AlkA N-terminal domain-containing protein [Longimicrobiaceae bacterium]
MTHDPAALYNAYASRDPRFDGVFFVGVTSTGIYCRPVCTARTPKEENCRFFPSAAAAERADFRPCLRCRPELAPGLAPVDGARRVASRIACRIGEGMLDDGARLEQIAAEFHMSPRQLRRVVRRELGVSPMELVLTRRLLLAKQLLTETALPVIEIAYSSGFSSLRRFNDAFRGRYGMPPTRLRKKAATAGDPGDSETLTLQMSYRPPFDWPGLLDFLDERALGGVESVAEGAYSRTVKLGGQTGWIRLGRVPGKSALRVELSHSLAPVLPALLGRLKHLFDLSARPDLIAEHLGRDERLEAAVRRNPGLRVPGAFDGFELAVRAVLGQQVTVKGATTLAGRFVQAFGEPVRTPLPELTRLSPTPERVAVAGVGEVTALGVVRSRARSIIALAGEVASGRLRLVPGADPDATIAQLLALPGIGPWTAQYVAMRALRWPDAFPKEDVALRRRLGCASAAEADALSRAWRPWRSYATLHLWRSPVPQA